MSQMTDQMSNASGPATIDRITDNPRKGEEYRCETCGMALQITSDCHCEDPNMVQFQCCGKDLHKV